MRASRRVTPSAARRVVMRAFAKRLCFRREDERLCCPEAMPSRVRTQTCRSRALEVAQYACRANEHATRMKQLARMRETTEYSQ